MKYLLTYPLTPVAALLSLLLFACGGNGGGDGGAGTGGSDLTPFCEADADCPPSVNECVVASCDLIEGLCVSTSLPEGSPCDDNNGVCRDGFCAATELKAYVKSPDPEPNALFGTAVSFLGDRLIVGAPSSGPPFGRVAVFERTDGQWAVVQKIDTPV